MLTAVTPSPQCPGLRGHDALALRLRRIGSRLTLGLIILCFAALALVVGAAGQGLPPHQVDPSVADGSDQARLDAARDRWKAARIRSYRYELKRSCFCYPPPRFRLVVVRHGKPTRRSLARVGPLATIGGLFRQVQRAIDDQASSLDVAYGRHGVPRRIFIDQDSIVADEEQTYQVRRFHRLSAPRP